MQSFGRQTDYLRLPVTDRCHQRCQNCRPRQYAGWNRDTDAVPKAELLRIVRLAAALGFRRLRLTGGRSLLWPGLVEFVRGRTRVPGVECVGVSTNGRKLPALAGPLRLIELIHWLRQREALVPLPDARLEHDPAKYSRLANAGAVVGFIGVMTNQPFRDTGNKSRLTAEARRRPCPGQHEAVSLREALVKTRCDGALRRMFEQAIANNPWEHACRKRFKPCRLMTAIGG